MTDASAAFPFPSPLFAGWRRLLMKAAPLSYISACFTQTVYTYIIKAKALNVKLFLLYFV